MPLQQWAVCLHAAQTSAQHVPAKAWPAYRAFMSLQLAACTRLFAVPVCSVHHAYVRHARVGKAWRLGVQVFAEAVEEAREVADRRAGRAPATQHHPMDFLRERPRYDATESGALMSLDERFPPLLASEATQLDAAAALASLRQEARKPSGNVAQADTAVPDTAQRLAVWCRFHLAPRKLQRQMAPAQAGAQAPSCHTMQTVPMAIHMWALGL